MGKWSVRLSRLRCPWLTTGAAESKLMFQASQVWEPGSLLRLYCHLCHLPALESGKQMLHGWVWYCYYCFSLEKKTFYFLAELLQGLASHVFHTELSSRLAETEYLNYLYYQACIGIKHEIRLFYSCEGWSHLFEPNMALLGLYLCLHFKLGPSFSPRKPVFVLF